MLSARTAIRTLAAAALVALVAFQPALRPEASAGAAAITGGHDGLDLANLDPTCKACDDFWQFATGGWRKRNVIPPGYSRYGSFNEVNDRNQLALRRILDMAAADTAAAPTTDEGRIGSYYAACNNLAAIESGGLAALQPELDRISAIDSIPAAVAEISRLEHMGVDAGIPFASEPDTRDSSKTIASIGFGGIGMPDRDYYLTPANAAIRTAYSSYLTTQLEGIGEDATLATTDAQGIIAVETALATATPPNADLRDPLATYHPMPVANLATVAPHVPWDAYLASWNQASVTSLDLNLPKYMTAFDAQLVSVPLPIWKAYLKTHLITTFASALPKRFDDASFAFYSTTINGVKQPLPRWKRCISSTDISLPDPLGKVYAAQEFPAASKQRALALVNNLQSTLHADIATLPWMTPATRKEAEVKLAAYMKKIGYPDHWIDFSKVVFTPGASFLADRMIVANAATDRDLALIGKPTDRTRWGMSPPTVNAYYNPSNNEIVFPAGILQPPFFDPHADDAVVYGAIGSVIGHEMTHGFDDQGRQFDAHGNLRDWWQKSDATKFAAKATCIVDQFNGYYVAKGLHENGRLVQGEAIADLGGATIAFRAFQNTPEYKAHKKIDGYTPEQRFFISYAQAWRSLDTAESDRASVLVDPHPQNNFRLIGTVGNMPAFQAAFKCAMNAPMIRKNRCEIW